MPLFVIKIYGEPPPAPPHPPKKKKKCNIQLYTKVTWNLGQTLPC